MLTKLKRFLGAFLYDEAAFQRYAVAGLYLLGVFLESGGVIPGTDVVLPVNNWGHYGTPMKALAIFLAAGGKLPSLTGPTK